MTILNAAGRPYDPHDSLIYPPRVPSRAWLRAASAHLLSANYATQPDEPGMLQPFPATAAACTALGWLSPTLLLPCDEPAGNLIDRAGALQFASVGGALQNRTLNGIAYGSNLWSKVCIETLLPEAGASRFQCTTNDLQIGAGVSYTISMFIRPLPVLPAATGMLIRKGVWPTYWMLYLDPLGHIHVWRVVAGIIYDWDSGAGICDAAGHLVTASCDRSGAGNDSLYIDDRATLTNVAGVLGDITIASPITLGNADVGTAAFGGQIAWVLIDVGHALTRAQGHDPTYRHLKAAGLGFPCSMTRATPMVTPISATQTACAGAGQVSVGYTAGAVSAARGNALGTGITAENTTTFLGIGSNNLPGFSDSATTHIAVDGANAMRSGVRVTMAGAWDPLLRAAYTPLPGSTIAAPSNDNYAFRGWVKRGTVGTSGQAGWQNSTGGVAEGATFWTEAATPVAWTLVSGTFAMANAGNTKGFLMIGATANTENCEFSDWAVVKGTTVIPIAYKYCGVGAAETMNCPVVLIDNTLGQRFSPAEGTIEVELSGFAGAYSAGVPSDVFHAVPSAGDAGRLYWRYLIGGTVEIRAYDSAGAIAFTMNTALVPDDQYHHYRLRWCAANPVYRTGGVSYFAALEEITAANPEGIVIDQAGVAAWGVPLATTVPNCYVGSNGTSCAARCSIASIDIKTQAEYKL